MAVFRGFCQLTPAWLREFCADCAWLTPVDCCAEVAWLAPEDVDAPVDVLVEVGAADVGTLKFPICPSNPCNVVPAAEPQSNPDVDVEDALDFGYAVAGIVNPPWGGDNAMMSP